MNVCELHSHHQAPARVQLTACERTRAYLHHLRSPMRLAMELPSAWSRGSHQDPSRILRRCHLVLFGWILGSPVSPLQMSVDQLALQLPAVAFVCDQTAQISAWPSRRNDVIACSIASAGICWSVQLTSSLSSGLISMRVGLRLIINSANLSCQVHGSLRADCISGSEGEGVRAFVASKASFFRAAETSPPHTCRRYSSRRYRQDAQHRTEGGAESAEPAPAGWQRTSSSLVPQEREAARACTA